MKALIKGFPTVQFFWKIPDFFKVIIENWNLKILAYFENPGNFVAVILLLVLLYNTNSRN